MSWSLESASQVAVAPKNIVSNFQQVALQIGEPLLLPYWFKNDHFTKKITHEKRCFLGDTLLFDIQFFVLHVTGSACDQHVVSNRYQLVRMRVVMIIISKKIFCEVCAVSEVEFRRTYTMQQNKKKVIKHFALAKPHLYYVCLGHTFFTVCGVDNWSSPSSGLLHCNFYYSS